MALPASPPGARCSIEVDQLLLGERGIVRIVQGGRRDLGVCHSLQKAAIIRRQLRRVRGIKSYSHLASLLATHHLQAWPRRDLLWSHPLTSNIRDLTSSPEFQAMAAQRVAAFGPGTPELNMFGHADQFHAAGHRSLSGIRKGSGGIELQLAPGVVCYAFACELYLKALHQIAFGKFPRGHNLNTLFGNLPGPLRQAIANSYLERTGNPQGNLTADLVNFATAFEDWRYVFEGPQQLKLGGLIAFAAVLHLTVLDQRPAWPISGRPHLDTPTFFASGEP